MEDFFKQFRKNLEGRPESSFEERDWQDLQKRLDRHDKKRAGFAWWWLALPLLVLLLGLNGAFFWELRKAKQKIVALEMQQDTIYKTRAIYLTDTIYKTRVIRETVLEYETADLTNIAAYFKNQKTFEDTTFITFYNKYIDLAIQKAIAEKEGLKPTITPNTTLQQSDTAHFQAIIETQKKLMAFEILKKLNPDTLSIPKPALPKLLHEPGIKKQAKTLPQHLYAMRPKGFQLGINAGGAFPFSEDVTSITGFSMGLQSVVAFSPSLQLWADATYAKTSFEIDRMDAKLGAPPVEPPSDDFTFLLAEVPQPSLQFSFGMQHFFNSKGKIRPFIGAGIGTVSLLEHEVIYEFENKSVGIEWSLDKAVPRSESLTNFWTARGGLAYKISEHLQGQLLGTYRGNWKGTSVQFPQLLGLQVGVNYRFSKKGSK